MGDRGNVKLRVDGAGEPAIYIYSHWGGSRLARTLAEALDTSPARARWDDPPYLARIVFDFFTKDGDPETGFGLSTRMVDNEHEILELDLEQKQVSGAGQTWTYEEFIARWVESEEDWP